MLKIQKEAIESGDEEEIRLLSDQNIGHIVHELFGGGIESTTMTILWFILYLIHNPEVRNHYKDINHRIKQSIVFWVNHISLTIAKSPIQ